MAFRRLFVLPTLLLLLAVVAPLVTGVETLYYRDVLSTHFPLKAAQALLLETKLDSGLDEATLLPLVDPYRAGQALLGNPNALVLYPTSLLLLVADALWTLNAHFWLHLLIAPWAGYWLGRAWGFGRPGAWTVGVAYASSGFFLSLFNLFNMIAGAALAPAFIAATLDATRSEPAASHAARRRRWVLVVGLWALVVLGGDPTLAVATAALAASAMVARDAGSVPVQAILRRLGVLLAAGVGGLLVAAPQIVELARILPRSARGYWRLDAGSILVQSLHPLSLLEQLSPLLFGAVEAGYWGMSLHQGNEPLLASLHPGWAVLALAVAGWPTASRRLRLWAAAWIGVGLFFALGVYNPLAPYLLDLPGASLLRYPVRLWSVVALALAVLAGAGLDALMRGAGHRRYRAVLSVALLGAVLALAGLVLPGAPTIRGLRSLAPERLVPELLAVEAFRWSLSWALLGLLCVVLWALSARWRRAPALAASATLICHLGTQLVFLGSLLDTDAAAPYRRPPEVLAQIPAGALIVHSASQSLFGGPSLPGLDVEERSLIPSVRQRHREATPFFGIGWGRRYALATTPEGLDSFFTVAMRSSMARAEDAQRVRLLQASGVDVLIVPRPVVHDSLHELTTIPGTSPGASLSFVYRVDGSPPPYALIETVRAAPNMSVGAEILASAEFDPLREVLLPSDDAPSDRTPFEDSTLPAGWSVRGLDAPTVDVLHDAPERVELDVEAPRGGVLVATERAWLPVWRARVDDEDSKVVVANLHRLAVVVPPGSHRVALWVDRRPTRAAVAVSLLTLLGLALLCLRRPNRTA
ncbi:MAG: hypothetical protein AAGC60_11665 [Acidobacteriota bacterium]